MRTRCAWANVTVQGFHLNKAVSKEGLKGGVGCTGFRVQRRRSGGGRGRAGTVPAEPPLVLSGSPPLTGLRAHRAGRSEQQVVREQSGGRVLLQEGVLGPHLDSSDASCTRRQPLPSRAAPGASGANLWTPGHADSHLYHPPLGPPFPPLDPCVCEPHRALGPPPAMGVPMVLPERLLGSRAAQGLPTGKKPQSCPPLPGDDPWQLRPPSGQAEGCTHIAAPSLGWQSCPLSPNTVSRGPASKAPSSLPRNLHASTRDSLGGPGAGPRAQDGSVSGGDRSPSPMPHTGQGVGAEGAGIGQRWHPGLRAATRRQEAWEQWGGRRAGETGGRPGGLLGAVQARC